MKQETVTGLVIILALALVGGTVFALWLIGGEAVKLLAGILVGGLVLAGLLAAAALPIRAWRKNDNPPVVEHHYHHDGRQIIRERVIDARPQPLPQLPTPAQPPYGVFPELLRASYQAGALGNRRADADDVIEATGVRALPANGWDGDITA